MKNLKYFILKCRFLFIYFSPYKRPRLQFYFGKIQIGTPYFLPRKWVKSKTKKGYEEAKSCGWLWLDFLGLGYKTKWHKTDYRHEWDPMISLVICKLQFVIWFREPYSTWESWLYYYNHTNKKDSKIKRLINTMYGFPLSFICWENGIKSKENRYFTVLKKKYHKYIINYE